MDDELQEQLFEDHPEIFEYAVTDAEELPDGAEKMPVAMFGVSCGDGWYDLIDALCESLKMFGEPPVAHQVKEKFSGLRFYHGGCSKQQAGMIRMAEGMSFRVCEHCGDAGEKRDGGWIKTLCDDCHEEWIERGERK